MSDKPITTGRFRKRLAVSIVIVVGLSSALLDLGSYYLVRDDQHDASLGRSTNEARREFAVASKALSYSATPEEIEALVSTYRSRPTLEAVAVSQGRAIATNPSIDASQVPELQSRGNRKGLGHGRTEVEGLPYLVIGGPVPDTEVELFLFFSEEVLNTNLDALRGSLILGWLVIVTVTALAAALVARRTLRPVAEASRAARSVAEGLLDTRLPVERLDEFGAWAMSFNEMAEALQGKIRALTEARERERRFTSDVAHELRTPITALLNEASELSNHIDHLPPDGRRVAQLLTADVTRLRRLVEDLMEMSRLDAGREVVRLEQLDVCKLVNAIIRSRGWDSTVELECEGVTTNSDRRRLESVIANLIANAVEHGGGKAQVRVELSGRDAVIHVCDQGAGIAAEHLPHLFDRFYKGDPARTTAGSGLGLALAAENASLLGGHIEIESDAERGTRFKFFLPE